MGEFFNPHGMYGRWNWHGLPACVVGFLAMAPFFSTGLYIGPIAHVLGGADLPILIDLPASPGTYIISARSLNLAADRRASAAADVGLDSPVATSVASRHAALERSAEGA